MTCTLFVICLCYLIFVMPISILNLADPTAEHVNIHLIFFCIYWLQYSLNFVIYALRSEQYRRAYSYLIQKACSGCLNCFNQSSHATIYIASHNLVSSTSGDSDAIVSTISVSLANKQGECSFPKSADSSSIMMIKTKRANNIILAVTNLTNYVSSSSTRPRPKENETALRNRSL